MRHNSSNPDPELTNRNSPPNPQAQQNKGALTKLQPEQDPPPSHVGTKVVRKVVHLVEESTILGGQSRFRRSHLECHAKTRSIPHIDEALLDDRIR